MKAKITLASNVIVTKNDQLLLGKRINTYGSGSWGLPGGHVDEGESMYECARRELYEETGIQSDDLRLVNITEEPDITTSYYLHFNFLLNNFTGEIKIMEPDLCEKWDFFSENSLPHEIFLGHRRIIKYFFSKKFYVPFGLEIDNASPEGIEPSFSP